MMSSESWYEDIAYYGTMVTYKKQYLEYGYCLAISVTTSKSHNLVYYCWLCADMFLLWRAQFYNRIIAVQIFILRNEYSTSHNQVKFFSAERPLKRTIQELFRIIKIWNTYLFLIFIVYRR